jgi:hypothetical protein
MAHPTRWWTQVAPKADLSTARSGPSGPSGYFDLEYPANPLITNSDSLLDIDLDSNMDSDDSFDLSIEAEAGLYEVRKTVPGSDLEEATIHLLPNALNHASHDDFLDVLSEELYSEEGFDMADLGGDDIA